MDFLPVFHNVKGKLCLVVGGGDVAKRKAGVLLEAGAKVRVVAPEIAPELAKQKGVEPVVARFEAKHIEGVMLIIAATNDRTVNKLV